VRPIFIEYSKSSYVHLSAYETTKIKKIKKSSYSAIVFPSKIAVGIFYLVFLQKVKFMNWHQFKS
jgi:hypothetical protein